MSLARSRILAVSVGKYAIFAGGYNQTIEGSTYVNLVEVLDVDSMQWKSTKFPEEFFSDRIGRYASNAASTNSVAVFFNGTHLAFYDPAAADAGAWNISTRIAFTPTRFVGTSLVTLGSVIYGFSMGQLFAYNMATTDLIPMQPFNILDMLTSVYAFALGTNVYFSTTERMYIHGTQSNTWDVALFPQPLTNRFHILALSEKKIVVFDQYKLFIGDLDSFQWYGQSFDMAEAAGLTLVAEKYIVIAGGYDVNSNVTDDVQVWQYTPSPPSAVPVTTTPNTSTTSSAHQIIGSISFVILACIHSMMVKH